MTEPTWQSGDVQLYLGDCAQVMKNLPEDSIDLTVTSPPYDNLRTYNGYVFDFEAIACHLLTETKPGGVVVWVVGDATINGSETGTSFKQALYFKQLGFNLHDTMIYEKAGTLPSVNRYTQEFEFMFILSKGTPKTFNTIKDRKNKWGGEKTFGNSSFRNKDGTIKISGQRTVNEIGMRSNIWRYANGYGFGQSDDKAYQHPATFPEALARDHILSWSNPGDTVFDPMMGSGTTGKMSVKYGRKFIGCEISEQYFEIAVKRIQQAQLQIRMDI